MRKIFLLAAILLFVNASTAFANSMPRSEMSIGGVGYGTTLAQVREIYGEPLDREFFTGEGVRVVRWLYRFNFYVTARTYAEDTAPEENLKVVGFTVTYNSLGDFTPKMPSGITVGMHYNEVVKLFGRGEPFNDGRSGYYYVPADSDIPLTMSFYVDDADAIIEITLGTDF